MINLSSTTDTIQVLLGGTVTTSQLQCFASYTDTNYASSIITHGRNATLTNNTAAVSLVASPSSGYQRVIEYLSIQNTDTATAIVTIRFNDNGTTYELFKAILGVGESLQYHKGQGWLVFSNAGGLKNSLNQGASPISSSQNLIVLSADVTNNNAVANTLQDLTGFTFSMNASKTYWFDATIHYESSATTNGTRVVMSSASGVSILASRSEVANSTTAVITANNNAIDLPASASSNSAYASTGNLATLRGIIVNSGVSNTAQIKFASEVAAASIIAKAGSILRWQEVL